jgi:hypothetical protein
MRAWDVASRDMAAQALRAMQLCTGCPNGMHTRLCALLHHLLQGAAPGNSVSPRLATVLLDLAAALLGVAADAQARTTRVATALVSSAAQSAAVSAWCWGSCSVSMYLFTCVYLELAIPAAQSTAVSTQLQPGASTVQFRTGGKRCPAMWCLDSCHITSLQLFLSVNISCMDCWI